MPKFLFLVIILGGGYFLFSQFSRSFTPAINQIDQPTPSTITKKVLVLNYDPIIESEGNIRLHEVFRAGYHGYAPWNNPDFLVSEYISAIKEVSHNIVNYEVINQVDIDGFPPKKNGLPTDEVDYLACVRNSYDTRVFLPHYSTCDGSTMDYNKMLSDNQVCEQLNSGTIDELWVFGGSYFGKWEANMAGVGAFFTNGPVVQNTTCQKQLNIMGFSYARKVMEMLEDFGHRSEGTMRQVSSVTNTDVWSKFIKYELASPGEAACGTVHFPPNGTKDYDWSNVSPVSNYCKDWLNYPNLTGTKTTFTCEEWGCTGLGRHKYWLSHLPYSDGSTNGVRNNWWSYIVDYEKAITQTQDGPQYFTIKNGSQDKNSSCGPVATNKNEIYLGINETCQPTRPYTATFDFTGVQIPRGATITKAHMVVIEDGPYENTLNLAINLQSSLIITPKIDWSITEPWEEMTHAYTPDFKSLLQQIVSNRTWRSGNTITLNVTYKSGVGYRRIHAYERYSLAAPKLVVEYSTSISPQPSSLPSPSPNSLPGDFNADGSVNLLDYNLLKAGFGTTYNLLDYNTLLTNFGT